MLALVLALASSPQLSSINSASGSVVYYDLLGLWFVEYSQQLGTIINIVVATLSYLTIFWQLFRSIKGKFSGISKYHIFNYSSSL